MRYYQETHTLPIFANRVFDEYQSPTISTSKLKNNVHEGLDQRSFNKDETPLLSDYVGNSNCDENVLDIVKLVDTNGNEIQVSKLYSEEPTVKKCITKIKKSRR